MKLPDRYNTVIKSLAGGGMSDTLLCKDKHLDRSVVIKALKPGIDQKRILDELTALTAIRSKHVVQVYDVIRGDKGRVEGLVEEYLEGPDISTAPAPANATEAMQLLYSISKGISDIHAHDRVHRDIKPDNMRRDKEGCLKIFDFGLAKPDVVGSGTKTLYFTPGYTPPEAFEKNAAGEHAFTESLDVFAFGATAYHLLNGGILPPGVQSMPPVVPHGGYSFPASPQGLSPKIMTALSGCLSADPKARPTMLEIVDLLASHLLKDKHRASLLHNGTEYTLDAKNRGANLALGSVASIELRYDGFSFFAKNVAGPVFINNMTVSSGFKLPGACVIVLGQYSPGGARAVIPVAVSHPEVNL